MAIIQRCKLSAEKSKTILPPIPHKRFNDQLKAIAALAKWTGETGKH